MPSAARNNQQSYYSNIGLHRKPRLSAINGEYSMLGEAIAGKDYQPTQLRKWPKSTDFNNENLNIRD